jgi:hypothetical protein
VAESEGVTKEACKTAVVEGDTLIYYKKIFFISYARVKPTLKEAPAVTTLMSEVAN